MPQTLETAHLRLRRPVPADIEAIFSLASDPRVTRLLEWETHADREDSRDFLAAIDEGWGAGDEYCWLLIHAGRVVGTIGCSFGEHGAEIGYVLAAAYWGRGLATEAARAVVDAVRAIDDVYRVWATCDIDNAASARVLEKVGLTFEARLARWSERPNYGADRAPRDVYVYAWVR